MTIYALGLLGVRLDSVPAAVKTELFATACGVLRESSVSASTSGSDSSGSQIIDRKKSTTQQSSNVIYGMYSIPDRSLILSLLYAVIPKLRMCIRTRIRISDT